MEQYALAVIKKIESEQFDKKVGQWSDGWEQPELHSSGENLNNFLTHMENLILVPESKGGTSFARMVDVGYNVLGHVAKARTAVIGDIHGELWVLLPILKHIRDDFRTHLGMQVETKGTSKLLICHEQLHYLFLGDYVDRGDRNLHTFLLPMAYKALCPDRVTLLQGNHEQEDINTVYGFLGHCTSIFPSATGDLVYKAVNRIFKQLPFVATVERAFIAMHGGITETFVEKCETTNEKGNFAECLTFDMGMMLTWSDPSPDDGWQESGRGAGQLFGSDVLDPFLDGHSLKLLLRGHQQANGVRTEAGNPRVRTIFSAADYTGTYQKRKQGNSGGWVYIDTEVEFDDLDIVAGASGDTLSTEITEHALTPDEFREISGKMLAGTFLELAGSETSVSVHEHRARMEVGDRQQGAEGSNSLAEPLKECKGVEGALLDAGQKAKYKRSVESILQQAFNEESDAGQIFKALEIVDECGEADVHNMPKLCKALAMDAVVIQVFNDMSNANNKAEVLDELKEAMSARFNLLKI